MKDPQKTTVTLLSATENVVETVYCEWQISRTDGPVPSPAEVRAKIIKERADGTVKNAKLVEREWPELTLGVVADFSTSKPGPFELEVRKVFEDCVSMKVPIAETISFVFAVDHMPISMREQWVRHRIGHKYNFDFGFETIPNIADSSWWSQTMRAKDMGKFAADGEFYEPEWLDYHGDEPMPSSNLTKRKFWREQHAWIASAYTRMVNAGMPMEDARNLLPLGCQHRMTWSTNLSALTHILSKRSCWIAQLGMWEPVVLGLVDELTKKVDPFFHRLVDPPCIGENGSFKECKFHRENDEYIKGTDPHHPCPLWLYHHGSRAADVVVSEEVAAQEAGVGGSGPTWEYGTDPDRNAPLVDSEGRWWEPARPHVTDTVEAERKDFLARGTKYAQLWGRDPLTGERKQLT